MKNCRHAFNKMVADMAKKTKKKGGKDAPTESFKKVVIFYAEKYLDWQETTLRILSEIGFDEEFKINEKPIDRIKAEESLKPFFKDVMKFSSFVLDEIEAERSLSPLELETPFSEREIIESN